MRSVQSLPKVVVPPAPLLPEDDCAAFRVAWRTYQSFRRVLYHVPEAIRCEVPTSCELVILQLRSLDIRPAEWVLHRFDAFARSSIPGLAQPPIRWVYAAKAVADMLDQGMRQGQLASPRDHYLPQAYAFQRRYHEALRKGQDLRALEVEHSLLVRQTREFQRWVDLRVACGEYVWGESL